MCALLIENITAGQSRDLGHEMHHNTGDVHSMNRHTQRRNLQSVEYAYPHFRVGVP